LSIQFGDETLNATADDIQSLTRVDEVGKAAGIAIRLNPGFDKVMASLTSGRADETGEIRICGEVVAIPVLAYPIFVASFVLTDTDVSKIDRLEALLSGLGCDATPES
jgi:hypothetical protein